MAIKIVGENAISRVISDTKTLVSGKVDKVQGKGLSTNDYTDAEKLKLTNIETGAQANVKADWNEADSTSDAYIQNKPTIPTDTSDLTNSAGFITNAVADLTNYYLKSETYTKTEIGNLISAIPKFDIEVVNALPSVDISETTIYLLTNAGTGTNIYDEYIYVDNSWEKLGSQNVDLSGYVPTSRTIAGIDLVDNVTASELRTALNVENGAEVNVQADWNQTNSSADDYIKNKPTITDTNQKIKTSSVTFGNNDVVEISAGTNVQVSANATAKTLTISATDTTYSSQSASQGGTAVSLVTTGEKYTWNSKMDESDLVEITATEIDNMFNS